MEGIWQGDILIADLEDLENLETSNFYLRRINAKEVLITQENDEFTTADGAAKLSERDCEFRVPTPRLEQTVRIEGLSGDLKVNRENLNRQRREPSVRSKISVEKFKANRECLNRQKQQIQGVFIYCNHIEPRVQLFVPKEETFLFH